MVQHEYTVIIDGVPNRHDRVNTELIINVLMIIILTGAAGTTFDVRVVVMTNR